MSFIYWDKDNSEFILENYSDAQFNVKKEYVTVSDDAQVLYTLTEGEYVTSSNLINIYVNGVLQPATSYTETSSTEITFAAGLPVGSKILFEWVETTGLTLDAIEAINGDSDHGSTAQHDYFSMSFTYKNTNYTASVNDRLDFDTTTGSPTLTLPGTPSDGDAILVNDYAGTFADYPLIINPNGNTIHNVSENLNLNISGICVYIIYRNGNWTVR